MFYNMYSTFHFVSSDIYTTFAGVNSIDMKKTMLLLALCALVFSACEPNQPKHPNNWSPQGRMYVCERTAINPITFEEKLYFGVLYFLSTEQVVTYSTDNHDYSVNDDYQKADTLILDLKYPNFSVRQDVWSERTLGKFLDVKTIQIGGKTYEYVK